MRGDRWAAPAGKLLPARSQRSQIGPGAGAELEEHRLALGQVHDGFHVVLDRLDEARAALGVFILRGSTFGLPLFGL